MTHTTESLMELADAYGKLLAYHATDDYMVCDDGKTRFALQSAITELVAERDTLRAQLSELQSGDELPPVPSAYDERGDYRGYGKSDMQSYARQVVAFRDATIAELRKEVDALRSQTSESLELRVQAQLQICIQKVAVAATLAERERAAKVCERDKVNRPNSKVTDAVRSMLALKIREGTP